MFMFVLFIFCYYYFPFIFPLGQAGDMASVINDRGCIEAGEEWLERNLLLVAGVAVCIAFLQVFLVFI